MHIMTTKITKARDAGVGSTDLPVTLCRNNNARKLPKRNTGSRPKIEKRIMPAIAPIVVPMVTSLYSIRYKTSLWRISQVYIPTVEQASYPSIAPA